MQSSLFLIIKPVALGRFILAGSEAYVATMGQLFKRLKSGHEYFTRHRGSQVKNRPCAADLSGVFIVTVADDDPTASFKEIAQAFIDPFQPPTSGYTIHKTKKHKTGNLFDSWKG
jgi:hypothetical protein